MRTQRLPAALAAPMIVEPCTELSLTICTAQALPFQVPSSMPTVRPESGPSDVSVEVTDPERAVMKMKVLPLDGVSVPLNVSVVVGVFGRVGVVGVSLPQAAAS